MINNPDILEKIIPNIRITEKDCWEFQGALDNSGYGRISYQGKHFSPHRIMWEYDNLQTIPQGLVICHSCDNPSCCNPAHLFLGSYQDNVNDMIQKNRANFIGRPRKAKKITLAGVVKSGQKLPSCLAQQVLWLYCHGISRKYLAYFFHLSYNNICKAIRRGGIKSKKHQTYIYKPVR